jgi:hypothetical protein
LDNSETLRKGSCHLSNVLLEAITPSGRDVAGLDGGSFEKRSYQLQAKHGGILCLILECPGLSEYGFPSDEIRKDFLLMMLHDVPEEVGTKGYV